MTNPRDAQTAPELHLSNLLQFICPNPANLRGLDDDDTMHMDVRLRVGDVRAAHRSLAGALGSDGGEEARWIADTENACPCCGGSGHKDDCRADQPARAGMVKPLEKAFIAGFMASGEGYNGEHCGADDCSEVASREAREHERILAALLPTEAGADPVRWQRYNPTHDVWLEVSEDDLDRYRRVGQKLRPLYATPPAAQVTVADIIAALKAMPTRTEALGGQDFKYIQLGEALTKLDMEYGKVESAIIMADRDFDGDSDIETALNEAFRVNMSRWQRQQPAST